ncbi:MAG: hydrogen gas-evolving membrane-bound hydrogenase subunit E [Bacteroidota bacterium]|nr:hydrogen gas-evolving membrane-bound hydrogenase subunit E [Bacteroidota bacterium]
MLKKGFILVILVAFSSIFLGLLAFFNGNSELSNLGLYYANNEPSELGAANLVTAIVVTYRGFDTLGEVVILFLTAAIIGFFLKLTKEEIDDNTRMKSLCSASEILQTAAKILVPIIFLFGTYIFINGHLTPGGGFQGGAVIASGLVLLFLANPNMKINHRLISVIESISGLSFVFIGILGIILAGGFLDNRIFELGTFGKLLSAGTIPLVYIFVGLKVGSELSSIVSTLNETQKEK